MNSRLSRSGIALVTVLIFVIIISLIALASFYLIANQAILIDRQILRLRAFYVAEAALQRNLMNLLLNQPVQDLTLDGFLARVDLSQHVGNEPINTNTLRIRLTY